MITFDLNLFRLKPGDKVLDIGCGSGRHAGALYDHAKLFIVAGDKRESDVIETRKRLRYHDRLRSHKGGRWQVGIMDVAMLPFPNESFDVVICSEVLEHIYDYNQAIEELVRVLKTGGVLAVIVPRFLPEKICWCLSREYRQTPGGHVRIFRQRMILDLLESAGVAVWRQHFAHSLHTPYWWLKCLVGPNRTDVSLVNLYQRLLDWEILKRPAVLGWCERLLNPPFGKSLVIYALKQ